jgi:hypothetical protein
LNWNWPFGYLNSEKNSPPKIDSKSRAK